MARAATLVDLPPYGFTDENQQPAGLDIDLANILAKDLKVELEVQQITGINRIPFLLTDKVDLIIGCFGATPTRARQVAFSSPYASLYLGVFGPKDLPVDSASDLGTHTVGVPRGTTRDIGVTELAEKHAPDAKIVRFDDEATTIAAQLSGQVDMFATANFTFTEIAKRNPEANLGTKFVIRVSSCHIGLRQGEPDLLRWVDTFVFTAEAEGGAVYRIYQRQNLNDERDFSCGLALVQRGGKPLTLARYNGSSHAHGEIRYRCHIHRATAEALAAGRRIDSYAEETDRYKTLEGALACLVADCAVQGVSANLDERDLFDGS